MILYNGWETWINTMGSQYIIEDGLKKTFRLLMETWWEDDPCPSKKKESNDEVGLGIKGGYSSDRGHSRHSLSWQSGRLRIRHWDMVTRTVRLRVKKTVNMEMTLMGAMTIERHRCCFRY